MSIVNSQEYLETFVWTKVKTPQSNQWENLNNGNQMAENETIQIDRYIQSTETSCLKRKEV